MISTCASFLDGVAPGVVLERFWDACLCLISWGVSFAFAGEDMPSRSHRDALGDSSKHLTSPFLSSSVFSQKTEHTAAGKPQHSSSPTQPLRPARRDQFQSTSCKTWAKRIAPTPENKKGHQSKSRRPTAANSAFVALFSVQQLNFMPALRVFNAALSRPGTEQSSHLHDGISDPRNATLIA